MNVPSAQRISGLVLAACLAACLAVLVVASGTGVAAAKHPDRVSARVEAELGTVTGACDDGCSEGWEISDAVTPTSSISGYKWHDLNADGIYSVGVESGLNGWTIFIDADGDGELDNKETFTETAEAGGEDGYYEFSLLENGVYTICEVLEAGWTQSFPTGDGCHSITLEDADVENQNFGNWTTATITGTKYEDLNGNGVRDVGEDGLKGWTIYVDYNNNESLDTGEPSDNTGNDGTYAVAEIVPGTWKVREVLQADWRCTDPDPCYYEETVKSGDVLGGRDFGNSDKFYVSGYKYEDMDADGDIAEDSAHELDGWIINAYVDTDGSGFLDQGEFDAGVAVSATTDVKGYYSLILDPGAYIICEEAQDDWTQSYPSGNVCSLPDSGLNAGGYSVSGDKADADFGNWTTATLEGSKWEDKDADGVEDAGDLGEAEWKIYVDYNDDEAWDPSEPWAMTDENGAYTIEGIDPGTWKVREVPQDGWFCSFPNPGVPDPVTGVVKSTNCTHEETFTSGGSSSGTDFGNWTTASFTGTKYEDLDANGKQGDGEPGLEGWTIYVDYDDDEKLDPDEPYTLTADTGVYRIEGIYPGTHRVREVSRTGWTCWEPGQDPDLCYYDETFESSEEIPDGTFGNYRIRQITQTSSLTNTQPSISGDGQWVSFVYDVDGSPQIYHGAVPDGVPQPVTSSPSTVANESPSLNRDGTIIAFASDGMLAANTDGNQEIFAALMSGIPSFVSITNTPGSVFPGFNLHPSIDDAGLHIAFASDYDLLAGPNADGNLEIFVATLGSGFPPGIQVTDSRLCTNAQPSLSGNSQYVAFVSDCDLLKDGSNADGNPEVFVASLDGSGAIVQVTRSGVGVINAHPSISTQGTRIAYVSDADAVGDSGLFVAELDLGLRSMQASPVQVTSQAQVTNAHPSLSGSGEYVAFVSSGDLDPDQINPDGNPEIFVAELNLTSLDRITVTQIISSGAEVTNAQPSISALGDRVAFISDGNLDPHTGNGDGNPEVFVATFRTGSDVAVQKTASADLVVAGEPLIYTVTVRNNLGPTVWSVVLTDTLTTPVVVAKGIPTLPAGVSCGDWAGNSLRCVIDVLDPAETVTLTLSIMPIQAGVITNTVQVFSVDDPFPENNEDVVVLWPYRMYLPLIFRNR